MEVVTVTVDGAPVVWPGLPGPLVMVPPPGPVSVPLGEPPLGEPPLGDPPLCEGPLDCPGPLPPVVVLGAPGP